MPYRTLLGRSDPRRADSLSSSTQSDEGAESDAKSRTGSCCLRRLKLVRLPSCTVDAARPSNWPRRIQLAFGHPSQTWPLETDRHCALIFRHRCVVELQWTEWPGPRRRRSLARFGPAKAYNVTLMWSPFPKLLLQCGHLRSRRCIRPSTQLLQKTCPHVLSTVFFG